MAQTPALGETTSPHPRPESGRPFFGLIDNILVGDPAEFDFDGALSGEQAEAVWTWMTRDLAADLLGKVTSPQSFEAVLPEVMVRFREIITALSDGQDMHRRLATQLGGEEIIPRLPVVYGAFKARALLEKAKGFGRAINGMHDDASLAAAVQSLPFQDKATAALLMQAMIGEISNPSRLVTAVIRIAGASTDAAVTRAGFAPVIDALLSHAQNQLPALVQFGAFADVDLVCRAVDRFHRLMRAVNSYVELSRNSRWAVVSAALTKKASERIEPRLRDVMADVNQSLRHREGNDRLESDRLLAALNGIYLLVAVRDARDSLALNAAFDQIWTQIGQALELHTTRNLEVLRENPANKITSARLEAGIKMAELRFNTEYADVLRRAREVAERRTES